MAMGRKGWYESDQLGKGAVALIFDRPSLTTLLSSPYLATRPQDLKRGWKSIDGGIVISMKNAGWQEYVHNPSLVQHQGDQTTVEGNKHHPKATSFPGEAFDAMDLLQ
jgi:hypothetical protein